MGVTGARHGVRGLVGHNLGEWKGGTGAAMKMEISMGLLRPLFH